MHFVEVDGKYLKTEIGTLRSKRSLHITEHLRIGHKNFEYIHRQGDGVWLDYEVFIKAIAFATKKKEEDVTYYLCTLGRMDSRY